MNEIHTNRTYYPALDGLRGIAILLVLFLHNFKFTNYFFFGWLGVDLFFVLSGFLITDILLRTLNSPRFLSNFYMRRVLRIFPVYYLALVICLLVLPLVTGPDFNISYYTANQWWFWTYLQNWLFIAKAPYGEDILLHTWSLAVEEQFYLVWPLLIFFIRKPRILLAMVVLLLVMTSVTRYLLWSSNVRDLAYSSLFTFTRIDGLCIGSILALVMQLNKDLIEKYTTHIVLFVAAMNFGFYFWNDGKLITLPYLAVAGYTTFAVLFGLLVHDAITRTSSFRRLVYENAFLKFLGRISYGLYVYHMPVYVLLFPYLREWLVNLVPAGKYADLGSAVLATLVAVVIAYGSYHLFEKRFLKLKSRFDNKNPV